MILKSLTGLLAPGGKRAKLSILIYHRVLPETDNISPDHITVDDFDLQMRMVSRTFNVLPLSEAVQKLKEGTLPNRAACITFDDGYADNYHCALPILLKYKISATIFVATGYLDGGIMWNDKIIEAVRRCEYDELDLSQYNLEKYYFKTVIQRILAINSLLNKLKYLEYNERNKIVQSIVDDMGSTLPIDLMMTTEEVQQLKVSGMDIGAHTISHPILNRISRKDARIEMQESKQVLENIIDSPVRMFAYPNGVPGRDYNIDHVELAHDLGFDAAVTTAVGVSTRHTDCYQLPRYTPWNRNPTKFRLRLLKNYFNKNPTVLLR